MSDQQPVPAWGATSGHVQVQPLGADRDPGHAADRVMIGERVHRYGWGFDERNRDQLAGCFTADGVWEGNIMGTDQVGPFVGREVIVSFLTDFWAEQTDQRRHIFTNVIVDDLTDETAVAHAYLTLTSTADATMHAITNGPYRLMMRKEQGVWLIAHLLAGFDAPF